MNARARGLAKASVLLGMIGGFTLIPGVATAGNDGATLAYVDGAWQVTLDSAQAWEVKLIDPAPQEIACGQNVRPCDATVYRFASTAECVMVQVDWRNNAHNSTDPRACRDTTEPTEEPTWTPEPTDTPTTAAPTPDPTPSTPSETPSEPTSTPEPSTSPNVTPQPVPSPSETTPTTPGIEPSLPNVEPAEPSTSPDPTDTPTTPTPIQPEEETPSWSTPTSPQPSSLTPALSSPTTTPSATSTPPNVDSKTPPQSSAKPSGTSPSLAVTGSNDPLVGVAAAALTLLLGTYLYLTRGRP